METIGKTTDYLSNFQCGICFEDYNENKTKPYVLECGHSICLYCLKSLFRVNTVPKCPFDNISFTKPLKAFPINWAYLNIISALNAKVTNESSKKKANTIFILSKDGDYEGEYKGKNIKEGVGRIRYRDGGEYNGEWLENQIWGKGKMVYSNGDIYEGEWANNLPNGQGTFTYNAGGVKSYQGSWKNGKGFGYGKVTYRDDSSLETIFSNGLPVCNIRKTTHSDQSSFLGYIENEEVIGKGYEITNIGDIFLGGYTIANSKYVRNGQFTVHFNSGNTYIGTIINNSPEGKGEMKYKNGDYYIGELYNYKKEGNGKLIFVNTDIYEGEFRNDMRNGKGTIQYKDGSSYVGEWLNDKRSGTGKQFKGDYSYNGQWLNDKKEGTGVEIFANGESYCGDYKNNQREGEGVCNFKSGDIYKGYWKNNNMNGMGILISSERKETQGKWSDGLLIEEKDDKQRNCIIY